MNNWYSDNLTFLRSYLNRSRNDVSKSLNIKSVSTLKNWEDGLQEPPLSQAIAIAEYFNVTLEDMIYIELKALQPEVLEKYLRKGKTKGVFTFAQNYNEEDISMAANILNDLKGRLFGLIDDMGKDLEKENN